MKKTRICARGLWVAGVLVAFSITGAIGLCQIEPSGRKAGLIQFDVISDLNMDWGGYTSAVRFARYWVCQDYYAVAVVWSEPHGRDVQDKKTMVVLSDREGFRIKYELDADWHPLNTTYPKPVGERPAFRWGGGAYGGDEMRFAEAAAVSRRVYVSDLEPPKSKKRDAGGVTDVDVPRAPDGITRKLAHLKVQTKDDRIESMDLFDNQRRPLGRMRYEYQPDGKVPRIATLVADLPVRREKLAVDANVVVIPRHAGAPEQKETYRVPDVNHVSHTGGRTAIVTYSDVPVGDKVLRLPVKVEVRRSDDKRLVRSARLMNFRRVDLDKEGVWKAAKAFASLGDEYWTFRRLNAKYIDFQPTLGPLRVDPNDLAFVQKLIAKYPLPEVIQPPGGYRSGARPQVTRPRRMEVEPDDARLIRQLEAYYMRTLSTPLTEEQRAEMKKGTIFRSGGRLSASERPVAELRSKLRMILVYHHVPVLPEDRPPEMDPNDARVIHELQAHYEKLVTQSDRGLPGQLKALHVLTRLDLMLKDYDAFERHTGRYLQMLQDAGLGGMYMTGGYGNIQNLAERRQYDKANKLMRQWADRSAGANDADGVYRFCGSDLGGNGDPWAAVQLLDRFLKRPGLSPVQRYEGLALRAISLDKIDKLLADPETAYDESRKVQAGWVLSGTTKAQVAKLVEPAVRQAVSAWEALGPARLSEAKPYSTNDMAGMQQNLMGAPDATRLQETSARLDRIVSQRFGQKGTTPRPGETKRPAPSR